MQIQRRVPAAPTDYGRHLSYKCVDVDAFRLQKINDIQKEISVERNERERSYEKYNKIIHILSIVETMAECGGIGAGSIGIANLASVVAAPVGFVLEERSSHRFRLYGDGDENIRAKQAR